MEHSDPGRSVLVVFARHPEPGRVKTRLAQTIGARAATELYAAFLTDLRERFATAPYAVRWAVAPPDPGFADRLGLARNEVFLQRGSDLGERMRDAFAAMRAEGFERCAIVGSDMPHLAPETVAQALASLDGADLVLGPAEDGGYYLIAAEGPPDVFAGVPWGSSRVLEATLARAADRGLRVTLLESGFDVDVAADLRRLESWIAANDGARTLPATAAALARLDR